MIGAIAACGMFFALLRFGLEWSHAPLGLLWITLFGAFLWNWDIVRMAVYFLLQSWLMGSMYCAIDLTFNPEKGTPPRDMLDALQPLLKRFFVAAPMFAVMAWWADCRGGFRVAIPFAAMACWAWVQRIAGWTEVAAATSDAGWYWLTAACLAWLGYQASRDERWLSRASAILREKRVAASKAAVAGVWQGTWHVCGTATCPGGSGSRP